MSAAVLDDLRVLHATRGRILVHIPNWSGQGQRGLETRLRTMKGVLGAQANALTANVLIRFDPAMTSAGGVLATLGTFVRDGSDEGAPAPVRPHVVHDRDEHVGRARIAVPGLERNPAMVRQVVDHYCRIPGVKQIGRAHV